MSKGKIYYVDIGPYPAHVGFTASPKAFMKEMKRISGESDVMFMPEHATAATHALLNNEGELCCIITYDKTRNISKPQVAALLAHEAVHCAQKLWERIGEHRPGDEAEAYLVQAITQGCLAQLWDNEA